MCRGPKALQEEEKERQKRRERQEISHVVLIRDRGIRTQTI